MAYLPKMSRDVRQGGTALEAVPVIDGAHLLALPDGRVIQVGAPPEALKVLLLRGLPTPSTVVLGPDPLYAHGINQASFEFLLYNHLFREGRIGSDPPFTVICDPSQRERVERLARQMLYGPDDDEMAAFGTPAFHRRQLRCEMAAVAGATARMPLERLCRIVPFRHGTAALPAGVTISDLPPDHCLIQGPTGSVRVPRRPIGRGRLPFFFAEPERPAEGARFGLQVIGSGSGFAPADWSSCFLVWIHGLPLVIDGTPYLDEHLERLGIEEEHVIGYLITHNHEDHANAISQLVNRRRVTVLTAPPVMAGLVTRLSALLDLPPEQVAQLIDYVPLQPGLDAMGPPRAWFGAEIRAWYSVHTLPTVGVEIALEGQRIRLPGDTLWGRQLAPLRAAGILGAERERFIQGTYAGADVVVADAGGGAIHPDPEEVGDLPRSGSQHLLVTHLPAGPERALQNARSGALVCLQPRAPIAATDLLALSNSPALAGAPERWLLGFLSGGEIETPGNGAPLPVAGCLAVLHGRLRLELAGGEEIWLQRGDLFHPEFLSRPAARLTCAADWTRLVHAPEPFHSDFLHATGLRRRLRRLYETRALWGQVTGADLPLATLVDLAAAGRRRCFAPGVAILRQGDPADRFHVLLDGQVEVLHASRERAPRVRRLGPFGPGYSFGECGILDSAPRNATVRAIEAVTTLEITARAFRACFLSIPIAHYRFTRTRDLRLAQLAR
jgi:hypothetical protein